MSEPRSYDPYDCLVPVFLATQIPARVEQIGTAVLIQDESDYFLFTAAHVLDDAKNGQLLVPAEGKLAPLKGYFVHIDLPPGESRRNDYADVGYVKLHSEFVPKLLHHFVAITSKDMNVVHHAYELGICTTSGYPSNKAKRNDKTRSSQILSFTGPIAHPEVYAKFGLSPHLNIVMHFTRKDALDAETLTKTLPVALIGTSGGGIFAWPKEVGDLTDWSPRTIVAPDWSARKLVGIFHTYKENDRVLIGTLLQALIPAIYFGRKVSFGGIE